MSKDAGDASGCDGTLRKDTSGLSKEKRQGRGQADGTGHKQGKERAQTEAEGGT